MMLSFALTDRYDPKEAYKHTCGVMKGIGKFFYATPPRKKWFQTFAGLIGEFEKNMNLSIFSVFDDEP